MAYSLNDYFRPLRLIFRLTGVINGLILGLCLLLAPQFLLRLLGSPDVGILWPLRLAGVQAIALGTLYIRHAGERTVNPGVSTIAVLNNALVALVLFVGYLQQEFTNLSLAGQIGLTLIFILHLLGAVIPIPFMRADYRRM